MEGIIMIHKKSNDKINEKVIRFILSLDRKVENQIATVSVNRDDFNQSRLSKKMSESDFVKCLDLLETNKLIKTKKRSCEGLQCKDLTYYIEIEFDGGIFGYLQNKKQKRRTKIVNIFKEIRAWATFIIAVIGLILSICNTDTINNQSDTNQNAEISNQSQVQNE